MLPRRAFEISFDIVASQAERLSTVQGFPRNAPHFGCNRVNGHKPLSRNRFRLQPHHVTLQHITLFDITPHQCSHCGGGEAGLRCTDNRAPYKRGSVRPKGPSVLSGKMSSRRLAGQGLASFYSTMK